MLLESKKNFFLGNSESTEEEERKPIARGQFTAFVGKSQRGINIREA
jgi:hypothetical protein